MIAQLALVPSAPPVPAREPVYAVRVLVEPQVAQRPRARAIRVQGRWTAQVYDDPPYARWRTQVRDLLALDWRGRPPLPLALYIGQVVLVLPRPVRPVRWLTVRGERWRYPLPWALGRMPHVGTEDLDNLRKGPIDALVQAGVLPDDRLVVQDGGSGKWWAAQDEPPSVEIRLWRMT